MSILQPGQAELIAEAIERLLGDGIHAALIVDEEAAAAACSAGWQRLMDTLTAAYLTSDATLVSVGFALAQVELAFEPIQGSSEGFAAILAVDARTGQVVQNVDARMTSPRDVGALAAARVLAAMSDGDYERGHSVIPKDPAAFWAMLGTLHSRAVNASIRAAERGGRLTEDEQARLAQIRAGGAA